LVGKIILPLVFSSIIILGLLGFSQDAFADHGCTFVSFGECIIVCALIGECEGLVISGHEGENLIVIIESSGNDNMIIVDPIGGDLVIELAPFVFSKALTVVGGDGPITISTSTNSLDNSCEIETSFPSLVTIIGPDAGNCTIIDLSLDTDGDGIPDISDNCPNDTNTGQEDTDLDGIGDVCDPNTEITTNTDAVDTTFGGDLTIDGASFTIPSGITIEFDFENFKILIKNPDGKILVEFGGKIISQTVTNACGGSTSLPNPPGDVCGPCGLDQYVCDGTDATICDGATFCETNCSDAIDNDGDGLTDCNDSDCSGLSCGPYGQVCSVGVCACLGGTTELICSNGIDDDCDGLTDCNDSDCSGLSCGPYGQVCSAGTCVQP